MSEPASDNYDSYNDNYDESYYGNYGDSYYANYIDLAVNLLTHYSFDLSGYKAPELIARWQVQFPQNWLHLAVVEALYQGRYKAVSVQQILTMWLRRGQATFHFNMEFERLICSKFPQSLTTPASTTPFCLPAAPQANSHSAQSATTENSQEQSASVLIRDKKNTSNTTINHSNYIIKQYQKEQVNTKPELAAVRRPPIPNIEVAEHEPQSRIATQLVKMLPTTTHHPAIEQFTPEKTEVSESFASKLKSIVEVKSGEC